MVLTGMDSMDRERFSTRFREMADRYTELAAYIEQEDDRKACAQLVVLLLSRQDLNDLLEVFRSAFSAKLDTS